MSRTPRSWTAGHATDPGLLRRGNEDAWSIQAIRAVGNSPERSVGLFLVADGMGGAAAGEVASRMAIEGITAELSRYLNQLATDDPDWQALFKNAVQYVNREIYSARQAAGNDMGTTCVGAIISDVRAIVLNVGDSRAYHINQTEIRQITKDHSLVQGLVDRGELSPGEVRTHPHRNVILRNLGGRAEVESDTFQVDLAPEEWLLLCTDGLWEMASDAEIHETVVQAATPDAACQALIDLANSHGGHDNITVVLIRLDIFSS